MARYGTNVYSDNIALGGFYYGVSPKIALSVEPFVATALDYDTVAVSWTPPQGDFIRFRLVRNQDGVPDTQEDGVILLDIADMAALANVQEFMDGKDNVGSAKVGLVGGSYTYYAIWLLLDDNTWYLAAWVSTLLAKQHLESLNGTDRTRNTHERFMDLLPKVFTSSSQSPLDVVDPSSDLYNFLYSFSYTVDEMLTYIDLLLPNHQFTNFSPGMLNVRAYEVGFTSENRASTRFQRRLVREASYIASHKGTASSIGTLVESMTGYNPILTASPNLFLNTADSTFRGGTGLWQTFGGGTLTSDPTVIPPTAEVRSLDTGYTGKLVTTAVGAKIANGADDPILHGIPVSGGVEYTFSGYYFGSSSSCLITKTIKWYDRTGAFLSSNSSSSITLSTTWARKSVTATAPSQAVYAGVEIAANYVGTYHLDLLQFAKSSVTNYHEARGISIELEPTKRNYIKNPSFENSTTALEWVIDAASTANGITSVDGPAGMFTGSKYLKVTGHVAGVTTSVSTEVTLSATGKFYTFSIYAKANVTGTDTLDASLQVLTSGLVSGALSNTSEVKLTNEWSRYSVNIYIPFDTATSFTITAGIAASTDGEVISLEAAQLEDGYKPTDYFDGSYIINGAEWDGTHNDSASYLFQNKAVKMYRLQEELPKFLPLGTAYIVESQDGIEFSDYA